MKTKIWLALAIVCASGLSIGFFVGHQFEHHHMHRLMSRGPEHFEQELMTRLTKGLVLSETQIPLVREKVKAVALVSEQSCREQKTIMREKMTNLLKDIRPLLSENQQRILDELDVDVLRPRHRDATGPSTNYPPTDSR
ncbi:MAG: hypothetical protein KKE37_01055 [Verrucomicrobia bacterium]|nr:hypothetical protein [Verrucomicrobiota bacterium]MBU4292034.1 hypothetical protein [Verrucomicrobiota bacterium]MBU4427922.1 hypothetical protein [Verrucomicrobiota bacterium]MCG2678868.1 hypothetical protein [Kiritimatiellia bacterium]